MNKKEISTETKKILAPYRKTIWNSGGEWSKARVRTWFSEEETRLRDEYESEHGPAPVEARVAFFWKAYHRAMVQFGPANVEVPSEFSEKVEIPQPEPPPPEPQVTDEGTDVVSDVKWAYGTNPSRLDDVAWLEENCPSQGALDFLKLKQENRNKWTETVVKLIPMFEASQDEQKSIRSDIGKTVRVLARMAQDYLSEEDRREIRDLLQDGPEGPEGEPGLSDPVD